MQEEYEIKILASPFKVGLDKRGTQFSYGEQYIFNSILEIVTNIINIKN